MAEEPQYYLALSCSNRTAESFRGSLTSNSMLRIIAVRAATKADGLQTNGKPSWDWFQQKGLEGSQPHPNQPRQDLLVISVAVAGIPLRVRSKLPWTAPIEAIPTQYNNYTNWRLGPDAVNIVGVPRRNSFQKIWQKRKEVYIIWNEL